ncbi:MAG: MBL fold metallo-hydrolase [Candidatus Asgardarchaeum californiense]|nr:MAG: MBL fold metallo-hydrolase [Candidatus Asgardarchaeum californiense]
MKLTIVYDNEVYKKDVGLKSDWGFSCLIEKTDEVILFDTGAKGKILLNNMEILGINPSIIKKIAISHEHWDHKGGLKALLPLVDDVEIYRLKKQRLKGNIHPFSVSNSHEITKEVYTTGRLKGAVDEQSLVLKGKIGWYVLVGCSHPGVERILNAAKQYGKIVGIIGGLHGFNDFPILKDLDIICPCHCTKYKKEIKELYPKTYVDGGVGKVIEI